MTAIAHHSVPAFTAQQLLALPRGRARYELIEGELIEMAPAGPIRGHIAFDIAVELGAFLRGKNLGRGFAAETGFLLRRNPDTVRAPDAAFVSQQRLPESLAAGYFPGAPDLAIEVLSPSDSASEVNAKVLEWLDAGCRMVIVIDPKRRIAQQWSAPSAVRLVREHEALDGGDVLPGWRCDLASVLGDPAE